MTVLNFVTRLAVALAFACSAGAASAASVGSLVGDIDGFGGQTAPGAGVIFMGGGLKPQGDNNIIRNITVASGYGTRGWWKPGEAFPDNPVPAPGSLGPGIGYGLRGIGAELSKLGHEVVQLAPPVDLDEVMLGWDPHFGRWVAHDVDRWAAHTGRPIDDTTVEPITRYQFLDQFPAQLFVHHGNDLGFSQAEFFTQNRRRKGHKQRFISKLNRAGIIVYPIAHQFGPSFSGINLVHALLELVLRNKLF